MNKPMEHSLGKAVDSIQQRLTDYACALSYDSLAPEVIHSAKVRIIDTLGSLIGAFFDEPCRISRNLAAQMPSANGATVVGTRMKTTPDMAAFVNATTARYLEMNDTYHWPGSPAGHPSDVVTPLLAVAEHAQANGREFITSVVLGYEVFLRVCDIFRNRDFDTTNFCCLGTAVAAGKLLGLSPTQLSHCISMAVVPNVILRQVRTGHLSMFKAAASGQAGRAGVFAALLARAGMEGPHLPFEGKAGWCNNVTRERFSLDSMGGIDTEFKVHDSMIKPRSSCGTTISSILAAEKVAPIKNLKGVKRVIVEVYKKAKDNHGTFEHHWFPDSRETADHSIPYVVAATLMDGTVTPRQFDDAHIRDPVLRALMKRIEVIENEEFTRENERLPVMHYTRVTIETDSGERLVGQTGGPNDDAGTQNSDTHIVKKFRSLTEEFLGAKQVDIILESLWRLEELENVAVIPAAFAVD